MPIRLFKKIYNQIIMIFQKLWLWLLVAIGILGIIVVGLIMWFQSVFQPFT